VESGIGVVVASVNRVANPVDARVVSNDFVHGINHDNLIVLVDRVLVQPVRV